MVIIIHGDDIAASRKKIDEYILNPQNVNRINLNTDDSLILSTAIESQDLFQNKKTVIIENLTKAKKEKLEKILETVNKNKNVPDLNIVLWNGEKINEKIIAKINTKFIFLFDLPKFYFQFLDSIYPGNKTKSMNLFKNVSKASNDEQLFYSIIKRVRTLMILKLGKQNEFEETNKMSSWQLSKLAKQAKLWNEEKLMDFYKKLFETELNMKTSNLPMSLSKHIDILLLSL